MAKIKSIFLGNIAEIALPLTQLMKSARRQEEIFEDHAFCDRFLFSIKDNNLLVTPFPINQIFFRDTLEFLRLEGVTNLYPKTPKESLCLIILEDKKLLAKLIETIKDNPGVEIVAYAATPEFYELTTYLKNLGLDFLTSEAPAYKQRWVQDFFDSKAGFRQMVTQHPSDFPPMPEGVVCDSKEEIVGWAKIYLSKFGGCVLKTNRGLAGAGLKILRPNDNLDEILASEDYWKQGSIVVEQFVEPDLSVCGGAPNIELRIRDGLVEPLYVCSMRVTPEGVFQGVELGKGAVPEPITKTLIKTGLAFGELLNTYGYQGYFETDWVSGIDQKTYPIEANLRRTGGTHVYELARKLLGESVFENNYVVANNARVVKRQPYETVKKLVTGWLYPMKGNSEGVILTIVNYLTKGKIGYVVIASGKERALEIESEFLKKLE